MATEQPAKAKRSTIKLAVEKMPKKLLHLAVWPAIFTILCLVIGIAGNLLAEQFAVQLKDAWLLSLGLALFAALIIIVVAVWQYKRELELEEIKRRRSEELGRIVNQISHTGRRA